MVRRARSAPRASETRGEPGRDRALRRHHAAVTKSIFHPAFIPRPEPRPDGAIPTFIPTTGRTTPDVEGRPWNIVPAQRTLADVGEHQFRIYDLFEGTEQIQQLVISRAISGVHIR
jgi:hypothetical protein